MEKMNKIKSCQAKKILIILIVVIGIFIMASSLKAYGATSSGIVNADIGLRLRSSTSIAENNIIVTMPHNASVTVDDKKIFSEGIYWYSVQYGSHKGYAAADYITLTGETSSSSNGGSVVVPTPNVYSEANVEKLIWDYLKNQGYNDYAIAGIMGNLYAESGLRSNNAQDSYGYETVEKDIKYTADVDSGAYDNFVKDAVGYGLAQWTYYTRKQGLLDLAKQNKTSISDINTQLQLLCGELNSYGNVKYVLLNATSVKMASDIFLTEFEKPYDMSDEVKVTRENYGKVYFNKFSSLVIENNTTQAGWNYINNKWYYLDTNGELLIGRLDLDDGSYYLQKDGSMAIGWAYDNNAGNWYFADSNGTLQNGWIYVEEKWYYMADSKEMRIGKISLSDGSYYLKESGAMEVGWVYDKSCGKWYYADKNGRLLNGWQYIRNKWYYMDYNKEMLVGRVDFDDDSYYLNSDGSMAIGWAKNAVSGKWHYANSDGALQTGWKYLNGSWYYLDDNMDMVTGSYYIDGKNNAFYDSGEWKGYIL